MLAREGRLKARLRELVEVESPSEDKAAVDRAGELVAGWAEELGGKVKRHQAEGVWGCAGAAVWGGAEQARAGAAAGASGYGLADGDAEEDAVA